MCGGKQGEERHEQMSGSEMNGVALDGIGRNAIVQYVYVFMAVRMMWPRAAE
ncbi:MAG TPA: hypothetical protein VEH58_04315 [Dehalococcoidales bacterium]|nr:hypothetical protein [Dehalococcoidales bacterium]